MVANIARIHKINSNFPWLYNSLLKSNLISGMVKGVLGFSSERTLPLLSPKSFEHWLKENNYLKNGVTPAQGSPEVYLFMDEFTNYLDAEIGMAAIKLLKKLNYKVNVLSSRESGRTFLSKGLLRKARRIAEYNIDVYSKVIDPAHVLVGIEPSAILAFRDEYPELVRENYRSRARQVASNCYTIDEFISREFEAGRIDRSLFTTEKQHIKLHGHCQQKAIATTATLKTMLTIPENYSVEEIKSGCCGMAGAFGYEKKHYDISMKIGELVLFPAVRSAEAGTLICASGTSCRQQIIDGTGTEALHPAEILYRALK
jgi:Fe-S oxidoreductase